MKEDKDYNYRKDLHLWFGLSYSSFLVLPRVLMQEMPEEWKEKMAVLLNEMEDYYPNIPEGCSRFTVRSLDENGKMKKMPEWLKHYRHPYYDMIEKCKGEQTK